MVIKQISTETKWKIVASSFIFNPTSAVKELIDNSIDAHGKTIIIDIDSKTGGCEYISVRDDGDGVKIADREMMCLNHSTSKIETLADLGTISTLGFRGEALFLLSTLASTQGSLEVITRTENDSIAERWVTNKNGSIIPKSRRKIPSPKGTCIKIKNLMNGLRARRKELELKVFKTIRDITQLINHYSIEFRNIRFMFSLVSLSKNGSINNKQLQVSINTDLSRVRTLSNMAGLRKSYELNFWYNDNLTINNLFSVDYIIPNMLPEFEVIERKKSFKFISINHRPLSNNLEVGKLVNKRLNLIYKSFNLLEPHVWYINFNCVGNLIDINIEPEKNNVMINNIEEIMDDFEKEISLIVQTKIDLIHKEKDERGMANCEKLKPIKVNDMNNSINLDEHLSSDIDLLKTFSQKKSGQCSTLENTTTVVEDEGNQHIKRRKLTTESFASEDDINWGKTLLDGKDPMSEGKIEENLPSSLTNNYEEINFINDDLELSRDISLSNPFTITKLKRDSKRQDNNTLQLNKIGKDKIEKGHNFDQLTIENRSNINPVNKQKNAKQGIVRGKRTISLFSEYTNSYITTINYTRQFTKDLEKHWVERNKIPISEPIIIKLSEFTHTSLNETNNKLVMSEKGWYIYTGTEKVD